MNPTSQVDPIAAQLGGRVVKAEPDAPLYPEPKAPTLDPIAAQLGGTFVPVAIPKAAAAPTPPAAAVDPLAQQLGGKLVGQNAPVQPQITSNAKPGTEAYFLDAVAQQLGGRVASTIPPMQEAITPSVMNKHAKQAYVTGSAQVLGSMGALIEGATPFTETGQHIREFAKSMETPMPGWEKVDLKDPLAIADKIGTDIITQVPQMGATIAAGAGAGTAGALGVAWIMNAGDTFNNLRELGVDRNSARLAAAGGGTVKAAFDSVLPMKILGKMKFLPADIPGKTASGFMAFLAPLIKDAGLEAGTEATQELVDMALEKYYGVSKETMGTALARLGNVAASAAVTGGAFGTLEHVVGGATAVPPQSDNEPPPSITPDDPTQPPPPPPTPGPTVAPEVPRTHAVPGPPTMDEVTAQIRSRVVARGGEAAIYGKKTPDDVRNLLGVRSDAPMEKLQELGFISPEADGTYKFTELVTGGMNFQPMPLHPGWVKSTDSDNPEYKYTTPGGPTFDVGFVRKAGGGPEEGTFSTMLNGEPISAPTMTGLRNQIDAATGEGPQAPTTEPKYSINRSPSTGWHSQLARVITAKMPKEAPADQLLASLKNNQTIKADELKWSGLAQYLEEKKGQKVSKEEVQQIIAERSVRLTEIQLSGYDTKFSPYKSEAQDTGNYREFLFQTTEIPGGPFENSHWDDPDIIAHARTQVSDGPLGSTLYVEEIQSDWHQQGRDRGYANTVATAVNQRLQEIENQLFVINDKKSEILRAFPQHELLKKVEDLVINLRDTVGSSYSSIQERPGTLAYELAREIVELKAAGEGYRNPPTLSSLYTQENDYINSIPEYKELSNQVEELLNEQDLIYENNPGFSGYSSNPPQAPFSKTWPELVFKRMLKLAVQERHSALAWTPGEVQDKRYSLAAHLDKLVVEREDFGDRFVLYGVRKGMKTLDRLKVVSAKDMPANIGAGLSRQVLEHFTYYGTPFELSGPDLIVGSQGMTKFYDKDLVKFAKKYVAQWEATVTQTDTVNPGSWTVKITPEMRDSLLNETQALYSLEDQGDEIFVPSEENFERAFPGTQATEVQTNTGQKLWQLDMPNGQRVLVSPEKGYIVVDLEKASEDYGEILDPESTVAVGKFYMIGQEGRIELAREGAGQNTLAEEAFHAAMQMALTEAERDTVIRGYGSEEKAAKAYVKLTADSPTNRFFRKIRDMFQRFSDIFAGQTPRTILNAISRGDVWTRMENTPEATIRGNNKPALKEMAALKKLFRNTPAGPKNTILSGVSKYFNATRAVTTLLQMGYMNPNVPQLQDYIKAVRTQYWMTKMDLLTEADDVLRPWGKVGWKIQQLTDKLIREVEHDSIKKDRRLSTQEIITHAQQIDKDSQGKNVTKMMQIWAMQDKSMQEMLDKLENAMVQELHRIWQDPTLAALHAADIQAAFNEMRKINYFPGTRFGKYGLQVKAAKAITYQGEKYRKGEIIIFETFEKRAHADKAFVEAQKKFQGIGEVMQKPVLDTTGALLSFPPAVTAFLEKNLQLSPQQVAELKEIQAAFSPGRGAMKHFIQKKGIRGASMDTMRVYADYAQHMSNHIAKIVSRFDMEQAIDSLRKETQTGQHVLGVDPVTGKPITAPISDALDKGNMVKVLETHYKDLLNPGNEFGALRGFVFLLYFGFYAKAAVVNLTQVPIFTWDYLAKRGQGNAARLAISKAYIEVLSANMRGGLQNTVSPADFQMLERGNREGFINESTASEVGAISSGSLMSSYFEKSRFAEYYMRRALLNSVAMHKATEVLNRRVTFLAALKVGRSQGLVGEALYQFAVKAVDMTQFEYSRWNKPSIMRGKTAPIFLFKQYQQHQLYYEASMEAGWRHYLALAAIAGLKGLPLYTELAALLGLTVSGVKKHLGAKNPKFDLEAEARKLVETYGGNPDLLMNGASRYGFGLSLLNYFGGLPIPALDFSSSVQMNKAIPGLVPLAQMAEGIKDKKTGMLEILADGLGAGSQTGMNFISALTEDGPTAAKKMLGLSRFMKDAMRAFDMIQSKGYRNQKGEKLVDVDMQNPSHIMEVVAQSMGIAPSRVSREYSARSFEMETKAYYLGWRENIINAWALALMNNKEALPEVKKNYRQFVKQAPREYWMNADEIRQSLVERMQKAKLHELGLPAQKRYWQLHKDAMELYQAKPEPRTRPSPIP